MVTGTATRPSYLYIRLATKGLAIHTNVQLHTTYDQSYMFVSYQSKPFILVDSNISYANMHKEESKDVIHAYGGATYMSILSGY